MNSDNWKECERNVQLYKELNTKHIDVECGGNNRVRTGLKSPWIQWRRVRFWNYTRWKKKLEPLRRSKQGGFGGMIPQKMFKFRVSEMSFPAFSAKNAKLNAVVRYSVCERRVKQRDYKQRARRTLQTGKLCCTSSISASVYGLVKGKGNTSTNTPKIFRNNYQSSWFNDKNAFRKQKNSRFKLYTCAYMRIWTLRSREF